MFVCVCLCVFVCVCVCVCVCRLLCCPGNPRTCVGLSARGLRYSVAKTHRMPYNPGHFLQKSH